MPYSPGTILLAKYRIERLLGQGAFGEVYLATHLALGVPRALKVLRKDAPGLGSQEFKRYQNRFQSEAALGAKLNSPLPHPNLLQVFDFESDGDTLVLSMQYAPGGSLAQQIEQSRDGFRLIPLEKALQWTQEAAQGLAELHRRDLVHRDVKPSNILLDSEGHARLADLGMVQTPQSRLLEGSLSLPHPGTREYMPPEQVPPHTDPLRPSADIYALGCTLFELLTGRVYFLQDAGVRAYSLRPDIPAWLDDLLGRMLAEEQGQRPRNGSEVAGLLQEGLGRLRQEADVEARRQAEEKQRRAVEEKALQESQERQRQATEERNRQEKARQEKARQAELLQKRQQEERARRQEELRKAWLSGRWVLLGFIGLVLVVWLGPKLFFPKGVTPDPTVASHSPTAMSSRAPTPWIGSTQISPKDGMVMDYVPAGDFLMGSDKTKDSQAADDELPQHTVYLDAYWIDQTEVTNAQYARCVASGLCTKPSDIKSYAHPSYYSDSQFADYPVINVDWNQANAYCAWAHRRLSSEAEWEKAARGTDGRIYPWGNTAYWKDLLNYNMNIGDTSAVGSYPAGVSPYGALDMAGNVWEWVNDWYSATYYAQSPARNPSGPTSGDYRGLRGSSWGDDGRNVRSASRSYLTAVNRGNFIGFRCAASS